NEEVSPKPKNLKEEYLAGLSKLKRENSQSLSNWKSQREKTLSGWRDQQKKFLSQLKDFKKAQFNLEAGDFPVGPSKLKKRVTTPIKDKYYVIPGALDLPIRNQGKRPTCAAFAGVRAIETLLMAHDIKRDLSEQYLYWLAKPKCQTSPCPNRGSWVSKPFKQSSSSPYEDIPLERSCPYSSNDNPNNQTHLPLKAGCQQGSVKVNGFDKVEDLDQVVKALKNNQPVVAGFKLSSNFYQNNGLVTFMNSKNKGALDEHANGHALLLIGYIKLPPELVKRGEGKLCFLSANSWGEGWGLGGHACLTESWVREYRIKNAFMALNSAKIKNK
ncbi:MAG: C1A family cysteine protease, partial [Bacteriovoracaceae bacterium]